MAERVDAGEQAGAPHVGPRNAPARSEGVVLQLTHEGGGNQRLVIRVPGWPGFDPGQFVMLSPGALSGVMRSDPLLPRPMAVYRETRSGDDCEIEILFKRHGRGTALLADSLPGQRLRLVGPLGRGFQVPGAGEQALLVAGGTGVASIRELAARCAEQAGPMPRVLLGARSAVDLMGLSDFETLEVSLGVSTEDGSLGREGRVTDLLEDVLAKDEPFRVYCCGPTPMMRRVAELAEAAGRPCVVSLENPMACGFGVCLGCAAPMRAGGYALVCREGPVFAASDLSWEGMP